MNKYKKYLYFKSRREILSGYLCFSMKLSYILICSDNFQ